MYLIPMCVLTSIKHTLNSYTQNHSTAINSHTTRCPLHNNTNSTLWVIHWIVLNWHNPLIFQLSKRKMIEEEVKVASESHLFLHVELVETLHYEIKPHGSTSTRWGRSWYQVAEVILLIIDYTSHTLFHFTQI